MAPGIKTKKKTTGKVQRKPIILEGVRLIYRNFSGAASMYNAEGNRVFSVVLTDPMVDELKDLGLNIKYTKPKEEGDIPLAYFQVKVNYSPNSRPPRVVIIKNERQTELDETSIHVLDWAKIIKADMTLLPYEWEVQGKTGIKPYLKNMFATLEVDLLEEKYLPRDNKQTSASSLDD
jgi:hypothetical protein